MHIDEGKHYLLLDAISYAAYTQPRRFKTLELQVSTVYTYVLPDVLKRMRYVLTGKYDG